MSNRPSHQALSIARRVGVLVGVLAIVTAYGVWRSGMAPLGTSAETSMSLSSLAHLRDVASPSALPIEQWDVDGAAVAFLPNHDIPMVDIQITFDAGAARNGEQWGVANLVAAMLGEGVSDAEGELDTGAIARQFESVGAEFSAAAYRDMGVITLRTLSDATYFDEALSTFIRVIAHPSFPDDAFVRLRKQTLLGIDAKKQSPGTLLSDTFMATLYADHPYGPATSGTVETVSALTPDDLRRFFATYYVRANMGIAIVGDLTTDEARAITERIAMAFVPGSTPAPLPDVTMPIAATQHIDYPSEQTHIVIGTPMVARDDPDFFALTVGNEILGGGGFTSRLNKSIRQEKGFAYSVYSAFSPMAKQGPFTIRLQTANANADAARALALDELRRFLDDGVTDDEIAAVKSNLRSSFPLTIASNSSLLGYMASLQFYGMPMQWLADYLPRIEAVTREDIQSAYARHLRTDQLVITSIGQSTSQSGTPE